MAVKIVLTHRDQVYVEFPNGRLYKLVPTNKESARPSMFSVQFTTPVEVETFEEALEIAWKAHEEKQEDRTVWHETRYVYDPKNGS